MPVKPICSFVDRSVKALATFTVEIVIPGAKPLGGSMTDSALHPSKVKQMNIKNSCELIDKK